MEKRYAYPHTMFVSATPAFLPLLRRFAAPCALLLLATIPSCVLCAEVDAEIGALSAQLSKRVPLNEAEKEWLAAGHAVRIRTAEHPPYYFNLQSPRGMAIDYATLICQTFGVRCQFVPMLGGSFSESLARIGAPQGPDLFLSARRSPAREELALFTQAYLHSPQVIFTREKSNIYMGVEDLSGKTVLVERGYLVGDQLVAMVPDISLVYFSNTMDALKALASGKGDAYVGDLSIATFSIANMGLSNLKVAAPTGFPIEGEGMMVRKDWPALQSIIDKSLAALTEQEKQQLRNRWLAIKYDDGVSRSLAIGASAGMLLLLVLVAVFWRWNKRLQREIAARQLAEQTLQHGTTMLERTQHMAQLGSWEWDVSTDTIQWSAELYNIVQRDPGHGATNYASMLEMYEPQDAARLQTAVAAALGEGLRYALEVTVLRGDGSKLPVLATGFAERGLDGKVTRLFGYLQDISSHIEAEQQLRIAATAFEAQEGMFVTDASTRILRVNKAFTAITGYLADDAVGQSPHILRSGRHGPDFYALMWEAIGQHGAWHGEIWNRRKNGDIYLQWLNITAVKDEHGVVTHYVGTMTDITQRKLAEEEIHALAFYDPLTGLPNRRLMTDRLHQALASSARHHKHGALMMLDLDNFKLLNDSRGHDVGDQLLVEVAARLQSAVREGDTVTRLGGDEFLVILEDLDATGFAAMQAETVAMKILSTLHAPYHLELHEGALPAKHYTHHCSASIGISLFSAQQYSMDELLKRADTAMYQAKAAGRNTLRFFDPEMQAEVTHRAVMEADLRRAIDQQELVLYFQMQVNTLGRCTGVEALVRWNHPQRGLVLPSEFIGLAEETGLILPLGQWVLKQACQQLQRWSQNPAFAHLTMAVNVSARQFRAPGFVDQLLALIRETGMRADLLKLELTESMLLQGTDQVVEEMQSLRDHGIGFSLDDFGTGYSSLSYLKRLPIDQLKIDQSFVRDVLTDPNDASIAQTVIALAHSLDLSVIAEGVEIEGQRQFLAQRGCGLFQGYLFGRPVPVEALEAVLKTAEA